MKRQFLLIMALLFLTILSACGGQPTQTPLEPASPTEAIVQPTQTTAAATSAPVSTDTVPAVTDTPAAVTTSVSFINDVMPILESRCVKCHGGEQTKEGLDIKTYEGLMTGSSNGPVIEAGNANNSFFVQQIINGKMPKRGPKLTPKEIQIISDWINSGAINN
ncbi:MAG: hypothetical protein HOP27_02235 [Anaerolineales bacterium]|nr:hypothetical protein [Anaerolineales bacterium]